MSKYINVDDLQRYCDNQKDHSITPNEFQRMNHYDFGWHTGTPTEDGWYLCSTKASDFSVHHYDGNEWDFCPLDFVVAWMPIEPYKEN